MLPEGTVTFLLTDVEGSTRLWETRPGDMPAAIARHYEILDAVVTAHRGVRPVEQGEGDSVVAAFASARDAIAAAVAAQLTLQRELPWLAVRMAVHTGGAQLRGNDNYMGRSIIRCARLRACGHGGQILVSETTAPLVADELHDAGALVDLGTARLRDLHRSERVWQVVHPALRSAFPPLRSLDAAPQNLPVPLTSFIGREAELAAIAGLLAEHRLVTLTGSGGAGKTRLALHAAADAIGSHTGGTWWVDLAAVRAGAEVAEALGRAVGMAPVTGVDSLAAVARRLSGADSTLVVLDNAEHVVDDAARVAAALLVAGPQVHVLVTSREPLGVPGEVIWRVPSLSSPPAGAAIPYEELGGYEAVRLFLERARQGRPDLVLDESSARSDREHLSEARRDSPGHRAGRGPGSHPPAGSPRGRARRRLSPPHRRVAHGAGSPADAARIHRVVGRPARRCRRGRVPAAGRVPGLVHPRLGRSGCR